MTEQELYELEAENAKKALTWKESLMDVFHNIGKQRFGGVPAILAQRNYYFVRLGKRGDPIAEKKFMYMKERGWMVAPEGVYSMVTKTGGDLIVCASPEVTRNYIEGKAIGYQKRLSKIGNRDLIAIEDTLRESLKATAPKDISINMTTNRGSLDQMNAEIAAIDRASGKKK